MDLEELKNRFGGIEVVEDKFGEKWLQVGLDVLRDVIKYLKDKGYDHLTTITGHDVGESIKLIYHLLKTDVNPNESINVVVLVDKQSNLAPSIVDIFPSALVYEREVYDLLGVKFEGHPNLKRLLLPEDTPEGYHPLRKS